MAQGSITGKEQHSTSILNLIDEGMDVYDRKDDRIGTVERLHYGSTSTADAGAPYDAQTATVPGEPARDTLVDAIADVFNPGDVPEEMRERLLQHGFVRIDSAGLFAADRYIMPDQISRVSDKGIHLKVTKDELLKR